MADTFTGYASIPLAIHSKRVTATSGSEVALMVREGELFDLDVIFTATRTPGDPGSDPSVKGPGEPSSEPEYEVQSVHGDYDYDDTLPYKLPTDLEQWLIQYLQDDWDTLNEAWPGNKEPDYE